MTIIGKDINPELSNLKLSFKCFKKPVVVRFRITKNKEVINTKEGPVKIDKENFVLTDEDGNQWPMIASRFYKTYDVFMDGTAIKKYKEVFAYKLNKETLVKPNWSNDTIKGNKGDYLVQYGKDDYGIVQEDIFHKTYQNI